MKEEAIRILGQEHAQDGLVGRNIVFTDLLDKLKKISSKDVSVLLIGETGTGKSCCAEFVHQWGSRHLGPFIPYNCGAGPESLFESQLFGHSKGAFTGAHKDRAGLIEEANDGILFLDETNSLPLNSQVKLNHFLESTSFRRVGENKLRKSNVRIIAASNVDLYSEVRAGRFRQDLYYRLAEYEIMVPALRERGEDVILLAEYFVKKNRDLADSLKVRFSSRALKQMRQYRWPGNIRELENVIKRCLIDTTATTIDSIPLSEADELLLASKRADLQSATWKDTKKLVISSFERDYLSNLLNKYHGKVSQCAKQAGMHPPDFWKLMRKYKLKASSFRGAGP